MPFCTETSNNCWANLSLIGSRQFRTRPLLSWVSIAQFVVHSDHVPFSIAFTVRSFAELDFLSIITVLNFSRKRPALASCWRAWGLGLGQHEALQLSQTISSHIQAIGLSGANSNRCPSTMPIGIQRLCICHMQPSKND